MRTRRPAPDGDRWIRGPLAGVDDGERRVCADCRTPVRSYAYRYHPPSSDLFERCVAFAWCPRCRFYTGNMAHIPRRRVLVDALADLPPRRREALLGDEPGLVAYLDALFREAETEGGEAPS